MPVTQSEAEYSVLLNASSTASRQVENLSNILRKLEPRTLASAIIYAELEAARARERELRFFVRDHPAHSYKGL